MPKTIRLDSFHYITNEAWRALVGIEMGMKNHELVPIDLAQKISRSRRGGSGFLKLIKDQLICNRLVAYESDSRRCVCGYRLTNLGYDYLALHQLFNSGQLSDLGAMIGAGKESDVYLAVAGSNCGQLLTDHEGGSTTVEPAGIDFGALVVVKFHRLGRTSFRKVKEKRDYHQHRKTCSWLYLDRLASQREFLMMNALFSHAIPVPSPLAHNRNAVVMSYIADSVQLSRVLPNVFRVASGLLAKQLYTQAKSMLHQIASLGLVHGDFNEFNLMVVGLSSIDVETLTETSISSIKLVLIDFPQMISRAHPAAESIYQRDAEGVVAFFSRFFEIPEDDLPLLLPDISRSAEVDVEVKAPGFPPKYAVRSGRKNEDHEVLLGNTARSISSSGSEDEESLESGGDNSVSEETDQDDDISNSENGSQPSDQSASDNENSCKKGLKPTCKAKQPTPTGSKSTSTVGGIISPEEVRCRYRRERRQQEQARFHRNVKRHMRAEMKRQGRSNLKAELTLFG